MKVSKLILVLFLLTAVLVSCKNNAKEEVTTSETMVEAEVKKAPKKELTDDDKKMLSSVLFKIMSAPQLKEFARVAIFVDLKDLLFKGEGPYTIFAPTNVAFDAIPESTLKPFLMQQNKANFGRLIKNHIVEGSFSSQNLLETIKNSGKVELKTLGGAILIATNQGDDIIITDANGKKAKIGTKDITADNGIVHSLDTVLNIKY